jgi:ferritin-like metal-binding protein YciE
MASGALTDVYLDELATLYDAEAEALRLLPRLRDAARGLKLRDALTRHCDETRLHVERLQLIFTHWGGHAGRGRAAGVTGIVQEADERLNEPATDDARDALVIGLAQRLEHYEIAAYSCARTYARRLNRPDEARLLLETLEEEGRAGRRLTEIAELQTELELTAAMVEARPGFHAATPPHGDKLR